MCYHTFIHRFSCFGWSEMSDVGWLILLGILFLVIMFGLPQMLIRRTIPSVLKIFIEHNATSPQNAKTVDELGLADQTLTQRLWKPRDYKPRALQLLLSSNIVQMTADGKLYISEENLNATKWGMRQL